MRRLRLVLISGFMILSSGRTNSAPGQSTGENSRDKESRFIKPETIQGCYELGTLEWKPDLQLDKEEAVFITPPERIQILAERGAVGFEKNGYNSASCAELSQECPSLFLLGAYRAESY